MHCHYVELRTTTRPQPLNTFVALHVFLVLIIASHDKLWGLARRVFTLLLFASLASLNLIQHCVLNRNTWMILTALQGKTGIPGGSSDDSRESDNRRCSPVEAQGVDGAASDGRQTRFERVDVTIQHMAGGASTGEHLLPSDPLLAGIPGFSLLKRTFSLYVELGVCHEKKLMH